MKLFSELQRRNVFRVAIGYTVSCWLLAQVADLVLENIGAPDWVMQTIMLIMALGFPVVVFFSWAYEVTPEGIKRESEIDRSQSITHLTGRKLDKAIILVLVLAVGFLLWERFADSEPPGAEPDRGAQTTSPGPEPVEDVDPGGREGLAIPDRSIAVLPFVNMSADEDGVYFADGLTEEILNRLAQLPELRVAGRTSSFQYKGKNQDLRQIAAELGVAHVLEGSVRRSSDRVRITAQLIRASDGSHLWSQAWDRTIDDIFATQDEIAERVAAGLDIMLDEEDRQRMRKVGVPSVEAFIAYQKGWKVFVEAHDAEDIYAGLARANEHFREATEWHPQFGPAWYWQADYYQHILTDMESSAEDLEDAARRNLEILEAASRNAQTVQQRAFSEVSRVLFSDDWTGVRTYLERALEAQTCVGPNWSEVLAPFGLADLALRENERYLACQGTLKSSLAFARRVEALLLVGRKEEALQNADEAIARLGQSDATSYLRVMALLALGRYPEAATEGALIDPESMRSGHWAAIAYAMAGDTQSAEDVAQRFLQANSLNFTYLGLLKFLGRQEELDALAAEIDQRPAGHVILAGAFLDCICGPLFDLDLTPNFKARLREGELDWPPVMTIDPSLAR